MNKKGVKKFIVVFVVLALLLGAYVVLGVDCSEINLLWQCDLTTGCEWDETKEECKAKGGLTAQLTGGLGGGGVGGLQGQGTGKLSATPSSPTKWTSAYPYHTPLFTNSIIAKDGKGPIAVTGGLSITGKGNGIYGETSGDKMVGVYGKATGQNGIGLKGEAKLGLQSYGVVGEGGVAGVYGTGITGVTGLSGFIGVTGISSGLISPSLGVYGQSGGATGTGVRGSGNTGVVGESKTQKGIGVMGCAIPGSKACNIPSGLNIDKRIGIFGYAMPDKTGDNSYGVYGYGENGLYGYGMNGQGVYGYGLNGVVGKSDTPGGAGVMGICSGTGCYGFYTEQKSYLGKGSDVAEGIGVSKDVGAADVVVADPSKKEAVRKSSKAYDTSVIGIISTDPSLELKKEKGQLPLALTGRVPVKASAENGAIKPGDLLTTSNTPGHVMKCNDKLKCYGAIVGKALSSLDEGTGKVIAIVTLS